MFDQLRSTIIPWKARWSFQACRGLNSGRHGQDGQPRNAATL